MVMGAGVRDGGVEVVKGAATGGGGHGSAAAAAAGAAPGWWRGGRGGRRQRGRVSPSRRAAPSTLQRKEKQCIYRKNKRVS